MPTKRSSSSASSPKPKPRASREFIAHLSGLLAGLGKLQTRPMFGGHGLYSAGKFFAFVLGDVLYLKADAQSRPHFMNVRRPTISARPRRRSNLRTRHCAGA
jgi:hypothetical protein